MNTNNLEFLQSNLKYLGFGDKLNDELKKNIEEQRNQFQLKMRVPHFSKKMDYTLHFKKSDSSEMYFFNRYDAKLQNGKQEEEKNQSFFINKGNGITAKEAFNLLEGRSVFKELVNKEGEKYSAWLKLDFENSDEKGNFKLKQFSEGYGYNLEQSLSKFNINELQNPEQKKNLLHSLEKGNVQQISITQAGKTDKFYIEAVPQYKNVNIFDSKMNPIKRQDFQKQEASKNISLSNDRKQAKKHDQKSEADDSPKQKQTRKRKLSV